MSHIAIDARIINSSTGRYVERLLHHLEQIDTTNRYSILVRQNDADFYQPTNPNFSIVIADYPDYSFAEQIGLLRLLNQLKPDLVHFCMPQQPILYRGASVTTVQDLTLLKTWNSDKNWLVYHFKQLVGKFVFRYIARSSRFIITPTRYTRDEYIAFANPPEQKVTVIYDAAEVETPKPTPYQLPFERFLLYVGQQSDYKNLARLGDAHQLLLDTYPDLGLVLVGRKKTDALRLEARFAKQGYKQILFTDFIADEQRDWLYEHCDAYVFPSLMEGFGLPGLEAMLRGAPVVSSNATCLPEVYGDAAHYFDPTDPAAISQAIDDVLSNPTLRASLIARGKKKVAQYSWCTTAEQTLDIYQRALAQ
ncbi:glycosyl transferase family 1 [Candidatus Saccharibacteria bacterium]|nr:MAG: glycosyl transferase family 1 [Candidatus Saccharibacteria bacterium]